MWWAFWTRGEFLGVAHYSSTSQIALRLLSGKPEPIDRAFFLRRIDRRPSPTASV